uniref:Uncharacterized protein n=1 Tax=Manihot esculenta TaxID=3983 RepID=A0A2C9UK84_MANES
MAMSSTIVAVSSNPISRIILSFVQRFFKLNICL